MSALHADVVGEPVIDVLGVRFHRLTSKQVVEQILHWFQEKSSRMMITAGPEFVMMTKEDGELQRIAASADLVTPDGIGILWAANRKGISLQERVTGVEVVRLLLGTAGERNQSLKVFLLGASEDSLQSCLEHFRMTYPGCEFAGRNGYFDEDEIPGIMQGIGRFRPDLWLVGLGQPRQEKMIYAHQGELGPCVAIGVGGSIDVWGGTVKRAPEIFRKLNLEWLYRLLRQPSRWKRQLALPRFAWQVLKSSGKKR